MEKDKNNINKVVEKRLEKVNTDPNTSICVTDLVSCEHYRDDDGILFPLISYISFDIKKGEVVGLCSQDRNILYCLIEILGNIRPYYRGLVEYGFENVSRRKGRFTDNVFYLDGSKMLYTHMTILEQMMFIDGETNKKSKRAEAQKKNLDLISEFGLDKYVLTLIKHLSREMRMVISILIACMSSCERIIINANEYEFSAEQCECIRKIFKHYSQKGKTIVFGTNLYRAIGICCDKVLYTNYGKIKAYEDINELLANYDRVAGSILSSDPEGLKKISEATLDESRCYIGKDNYVYFYDCNFDEILKSNIIPAAQKRNINILSIRKNNGRVQNCVEELEGEIYDLQ